MADIFNSRPGFVNIFTGGADQVLPGKIRLGNEENEAYIMVGADYDQETIQQFQLSMRNSVYVYVFGDGMGKIVLNGILFASTCSNVQGMGEIIYLYNKYRITNMEREGKPVNVMIDLGEEKTIQGYLTALTINMKGAGSDPGALGLFDFRMTINTLPGN